MNIGGVDEIKIFGIGPQLDLGNFTVGLATIVVAFVTLYVALRAARSTNNHKLAEFRQVWIDDLRSHIAQFVGCVDGALNYACSASEGVDCKSELDRQFSEMKRLESYITLKLNPNEKDHRVLTELVAQARGRASGFVFNVSAALSDETHLLIRLIVDYSRIILKTEWDRVRDETRGRGLIRKFLASARRRRRRKDFELSTREKVESFFSKHNIRV